MRPRNVARRLALVVVLLLFTGVAMRGLNGLLLGMHRSGGEAHSVSSLAPLRTDPRDLVDNARGVINGWKAYAAAESPGVANAWDVVQWAMGLDILLFAPLYAYGLIVLIRFARRRMHDRRAGKPGERELLAAREHATVFGVVAAWVAFVADELENLWTLVAVGVGWNDVDSGWVSVSAVFIWIFAWVKWLAAAVAVLVALLLLVWLIFGGGVAPDGGWGAFRRRLRAIALHLVLVAFAAVLLFLHEQIPDLVRRWDPIALALTTLLATWFALLVFLCTRRLLTMPRREPLAPDREVRVERKIVVWLCLLAAVQLVVHRLSHGEWDPGWGLVIPAAIMLLVSIAGKLVPSDVERRKDRAREWEPPVPRAESKSGASPRLPRFLAALVLVGFGLGIFEASFAYAVYARDVGWEAALIPGLAFALVVVRLFIRRGHPLAWAISGGYVGVLALGLVHDWDEQLSPSVMVVSAVLVGALGWYLYDALAGIRPASQPLSRRATLPAGALVLVIGIAVIARPTAFGEELSAIGVLLAFLIAAILVVSVIAWAAPGLPLPKLFRMLRLRSFPVLTLLALWFALASTFDQGGFHDFRLQRDVAASAKGTTLEEAFACWLGKNGLAPIERGCTRPQGADVRSSRAGQGATPLILVATTGGGIRAAYWTALVLDCAFERTGDCRTDSPTADFDRSNAVFALSGISGGSVGLAEYAAYLIEKRAEQPNPDWVRDALHVDALSGAGAWWLFVELPRVFFQFDVPRDRAGVQEQGWEERWEDGELGRGIFDVWRNEPQVPLLLLNGTSVTDGCRFNTSVLDGNVERVVQPLPDEEPDDTESRAFSGCRSIEPFDERDDTTPATPEPPNVTRVAPESVLPGTRDLVDYLCEENLDVRLSTAGLLSGRFPFVNSSGRIERQCETEKFQKPIAYVVDGGYLDTSGASPLIEAMHELEPLIEQWNRDNAPGCIVPLMIQIDNGFETGAGRSARPKELFVPSDTLSSSRLGRAAEARAGAGLLFDTRRAGQVGPVDRYAHFVNQVHAGPHAPLGWAQSEFSERELEDQLPKAQNQQALAEVRRWLTPDALSCA